MTPVKIARRVLWQALSWNYSPLGINAKNKIKSLRNKHEGKKAVILCNGPSLLKTDFSMLEDTFTIGLNKINLLFDQAAHRPDMVVAINPYVLEQNKSFFNETAIPLFLDSEALKKGVKNRENIHLLKALPLTLFSTRPDTWYNQGYTVTFAAMQLAYFMGFEKVALIGCDHNFPGAEGPANSLVESNSDDKCHFDPNYFGKGMKWQLPDLIQSEVSYLLALSKFSEKGRTLVNCTDGGKLEILPRMALKDFVN